MDFHRGPKKAGLKILMVSAAPRVLIVEDNPDDRDLLLRQLRKAGLAEQVRVINDGREALTFLTASEEESDQLVAVFLDLNLPSLSGLQLLEKMRAHPKKKNLPVIVMTSSNSPNDLARCNELRVTNYVQKPVTFSAFTKAVADTFHLPPDALGKA